MKRMDGNSPHRRIVLMLSLATALLASVGRTAAQESPSPKSMMLSPEEEIRRTILADSMGPWTVRDLNLPDAFVSRVVDRIIREAYRNQNHLVVRDNPELIAVGENDQPVNTQVDRESLDASKPQHWPVKLHDPGTEPPEGRKIRRYREARPSNRGFSYWESIASTQPARLQEIDYENLSPRLKQAADIVGRRLARDGLLWTTVQVMQMLESDWPEQSGAQEKLLAQLGVPVDLFRHFVAKSSRKHRKISPLEDLSDVVGDDSLTAEKVAERFTFQWLPADPSFRAMTESGEKEIGLARLQITRSLHWAGKGSGDGLDVARQIVAALPNTRFLLATQQSHGLGTQAALREWTIDAGRSFELLETSQQLSQWAQDNGKGGVVDGNTWATLVPRYASRGEIGAMFIPIESAVLDRWRGYDHRILPSTLLFQGGNTLCVRNPANNTRILLVGEADIHRNVALGLTREQVESGFAREFGVDRVIVLPAVSYHVDFDVSVRAHDGKLVAFVNDPVLASRWMVAVCVATLEQVGLLDEANAESARKAIAEGNDRNIVAIVGSAIRQAAVPTGGYPLTLAKRFSTRSTDSGIGNLQRLLVALDMLAASAIPPKSVAGDRDTVAYIKSIHRQLDDTQALSKLLADAGFTVVALPSLSAGTRSVHYLNGMHTRTAYLLPAYGGLFESVDTAAAEAIRQALDPTIRLVPIGTSESQRRNGAVHCTMSAYPRLTAPIPKPDGE